MELPQKYIKRIDGFLERLGCEYIDIRFEMVDHIASDIENKVTNYDDFFQKDGMRGKFLGYMLRQKKELENNYYQQSKKQFWIDLWGIIKAITKQLFQIKTLVLIILTFLLLQQFISYSVKYAVISFSFISFTMAIFNIWYVTKSIKQIGKVRVVHSYYSIITVLFYLSYQVPNIINIYKVKNHIPFFPYFQFVVIVLNILVLLDFIKHKNTFKEKYKYLLR